MHGQNEVRNRSKPNTMRALQKIIITSQQKICEVHKFGICPILQVTDGRS